MTLRTPQQLPALPRNNVYNPFKLDVWPSQDTLFNLPRTNVDNFPSESTIDPVNAFTYKRPLSKTAPLDLKEHINATTDAGAQLYVQTIDGAVVAQTNKFFLNAFSFGMKERTQLMETFSAPSIAFFGESVRIYNFAGTAVDYAGSNGPRFYQSSLIKMYNDMLRGTLLVERNQIAIITVLNHTIYGYPIAFQSNYSAQNDKMATFSMSWVVTEHDLTLPGVIGDDQLNYMYTHNVAIPKGLIRDLPPLMGAIADLGRFFNFSGWLDLTDDTAKFAFLANREWSSVTPYEIQSGFGSEPKVFIDALDRCLARLSVTLNNIADSAEYSPILSSLFSDPNNAEQTLKDSITKTFKEWSELVPLMWTTSGFSSSEFINFKNDLAPLITLYNKLLTIQRAKLAQASVDN